MPRPANARARGQAVKSQCSKSTRAFRSKEWWTGYGYSAWRLRLTHCQFELSWGVLVLFRLAKKFTPLNPPNKYGELGQKAVIFCPVSTKVQVHMWRQRAKTFCSPVLGGINYAADRNAPRSKNLLRCWTSPQHVAWEQAHVAKCGIAPQKLEKQILSNDAERTSSIKKCVVYPRGFANKSPTNQLLCCGLS